MKGLRSIFSTAIFSRSSLLTSTSKCPALARMALCFIFSKCLAVMTSRQPVAVTKISPIGAASSIVITRNPSITASSARKGFTSVTITFAPSPFARIAMPFEQKPYPATTTVRPVTMLFVVYMIPSQTLCPVPWRLSKRCLQSASLTASMGKGSEPSLARARSL